MPRGNARRSTGKAGLGLGLLALALAACSSTNAGDTQAAEPEPGATTTAAAPAAPAPPPTWPLTGLPVTGGGDGSRRHPVIVLKMDNTSSSAPQQGLGDADLVVEELVEGGLTRLAAFFYSQIPGDVGPVRSMRASDIGIVSPVDATVVTSGAASVTIDRIRKAGIPYFNEGSAGFFRDSSRSAPYNLFTNLTETATLTRGPEARPADYLPWGTAEQLPEGRPASALVARFGSGHSTEWSYAEGRYTNENSYAAEGDEFPTDTVLVLRVQVGDAGYTDPAGYPVPETKFVGSGPAQVFHQGRVVRATWKKKSVNAPVTLTSQGKPLAVPAGHTWVELVPAETGEVAVTR
ncbi:MAG: DUF3048 domain-containing protein [Nocardioides sp.]|nr:DUF3048 domain-containing protein [Nocardioides sp.]